MIGDKIDMALEHFDFSIKSKYVSNKRLFDTCEICIWCIWVTTGLTQGWPSDDFIPPVTTWHVLGSHNTIWYLVSRSSTPCPGAAVGAAARRSRRGSLLMLLQYQRYKKALLITTNKSSSCKALFYIELLNPIHTTYLALSKIDYRTILASKKTNWHPQN